MMIKMENVNFRYEQGERGVSDICLNIRRGECVVLTGASGSGKTTILRLVNGLAPEYYSGVLSGKIEIDGRATEELEFWEKGKQIGSVFQEPQSQFFSSDLAGEIAFGCENYGLKRSVIIERTEHAIQTFGLSTLRERSLDMLSDGEKQRVAIASVYAMVPSIYVCDEPTANLDEESAMQLAETLKKLKVQNHTLMIAEHRLSWLREIADRYIYMQDGRILWEKDRSQMRKMTREESLRYGLRSFESVPKPMIPKPQETSSLILEVQAVYYEQKSKSLLKEISFSAEFGQIIAVTGHNGAGKTTLGTMISGLKKESGGTIWLDGKKSSPAERRKRIWYSANDTGTQFFTESVSEEIFLYRKVSKDQIDNAIAVLKMLGLYELKDVHPATLSGGQKQRLSIACGLLSDRDILIFDEPTSGLDGYNTQIISEAFRKTAKNNKVILIITHDYELIETCCSHMIDLASGNR